MADPAYSRILPHLEGPRPVREIACAGCGVRFTTKRADQSFCTRRCYYDNRTPKTERACPGCGIKWCAPASNPSQYCSKPCLKQHLGWIEAAEAQCATCGTQFKARARHGRSDEQQPKYCSPQCAHEGARREIVRQCVSCGGGFSILPQMDNRTCSWRCKNEFYRDERSGSWKGGEYSDDRNFVRVRLPRPGYVSKYDGEHRVVAARAIGRPLTRGEVVLHINGDHADNRDANLFICASRSEAALLLQGSLRWPATSNLHNYTREIEA